MVFIRIAVLVMFAIVIGAAVLTQAWLVVAIWVPLLVGYLYVQYRHVDPDDWHEHDEGD